MKNFIIIIISSILAVCAVICIQQWNEIEDLKFHIFVLGQQKKLEDCTHTRILQMYKESEVQLTEELYDERKKHHPASADIFCEVELRYLNFHSWPHSFPDCF